ncbi:hypothetical protein GCK32_015892 [Trichostrongylus colubriformis]|uniref:Uncharacterized protein n=1 Tax=Trichostrongylus colubriformis TaxID=6319 RepID=A0AAN8IH91_TRICO
MNCAYTAHYGVSRYSEGGNQFSLIQLGARQSAHKNSGPQVRSNPEQPTDDKTDFFKSGETLADDARLVVDTKFNIKADLKNTDVCKAPEVDESTILGSENCVEESFIFQTEYLSSSFTRDYLLLRLNSKSTFNSFGTTILCSDRTTIAESISFIQHSLGL